MKRFLSVAVLTVLCVSGCATTPREAAPKETCTALGDPQKPTHYLCGTGSAAGILKEQQGWRFEGDKAVGRWIEIRYSKPEWIRTLYLDNGCDSGSGSVNEVEVTTPDGQLLRYRLASGGGNQMITLPDWGQVRSFKVAITELEDRNAPVCLRNVRADLDEQRQDQNALDGCLKRTAKDSRQRCLRDLRVHMQENLRRQAAFLPAGKLRNANEQWSQWLEQECDALSRLGGAGAFDGVEVDRCVIERLDQRTWQLRQMNERIRKVQ